MNFRVMAEIAGNKVNMGNYEYRVKRVPKPDATISGYYKGGPIKKEILAAGALIPILDRFEFKLFYVTTEFKMIVLNNRNYVEFNSVNSKLTKEMRDAIRDSKPGTKILFENIYAKMDKPNSSAQILQPLSFTLQ